jgi:hypothetical protein
VSQQSNIKDTESYFLNWQTPQFYRCYYRRFVYFAIFLTLTALCAISVAAYRYHALYLKETAQHYVTTSEGELVLLSPHFENQPLPKHAGDK